MTCRCAPNARCGACFDDDRLTLAVELVKNDAKVKRCGFAGEGGVCVRAAGHADDHEYESAESIIPIS